MAEMHTWRTPTGLLGLWKGTQQTKRQNSSVNEEQSGAVRPLRNTFGCFSGCPYSRVSGVMKAVQNRRENHPPTPRTITAFLFVSPVSPTIVHPPPPYHPRGSCSYHTRSHQGGIKPTGKSRPGFRTIMIYLFPVPCNPLPPLPHTNSPILHHLSYPTQAPPPPIASPDPHKLPYHPPPPPSQTNLPTTHRLACPTQTSLPSTISRVPHESPYHLRPPLSDENSSSTHFLPCPT